MNLNRHAPVTESNQGRPWRRGWRWRWHTLYLLALLCNFLMNTLSNVHRSRRRRTLRGRPAAFGKHGRQLYGSVTREPGDQTRNATELNQDASRIPLRLGNSPHMQNGSSQIKIIYIRSLSHCEGHRLYSPACYVKDSEKQEPHVPIMRKKILSHPMASRFENGPS